MAKGRHRGDGAPPTPAPAPAAASSAGPVIAALEELYAQLPLLECRGLCGHSCAAHVDASAAERARIAEQGVDLDAPTPDGACPALSRALVSTGRCTVHEVRPMVCRLWGTAAAMPCPHGCTPAGGVVEDRRAMSWLMAILELGGHHLVADPRVRDMLQVAQNDDVAAGLLARYLRGDRSVAPALGARLLALQDDRGAGQAPASSVGGQSGVV